MKVAVNLFVKGEIVAAQGVEGGNANRFWITSFLLVTLSRKLFLYFKHL